MGLDTHNAHFHVRHTLQRLCTLSQRNGAFVFVFASTSATIHRPFYVCKGRTVFKLLLWHYLPAYFYPRLAWYGAAKQNEFGFLIPYALFETMSAAHIIARRISRFKTSNRYAKTGFLFCTWQIGNYTIPFAYLFPAF